MTGKRSTSNAAPRASQRRPPRAKARFSRPSFHRPSRTTLLHPLQNSSISVRLFALAGVPTALLLVVALISLGGFGTVDRKNRGAAAADTNLALASSAYDGWLTSDDQTNMYIAVAELQERSAKKLAAATWQQVVQGRAQAQRAVSQLLAARLSDHELNLVRDLEVDLPTYNAYASRMYDLVSTTAGEPRAEAAVQLTQGNQLVTVDNAPISNQIQSAFDQFEAQLAATRRESSTQIGTTVAARSSGTLAVSAAAVLLALLVTLVVIRSIRRPLRKVATVAERFQSGAADMEVDVFDRSEIGVFAEAFRGAVDGRRQLAAGMEQLAAGNLGADIPVLSPQDVLGTTLLKLQATMRESLGEHSAMVPLQRGLHELSRTLKEFQEGLSAMESGDLTVAVEARLTPITPTVDGEPLGFVADSYNEMIGYAYASIDSYNEMRRSFSLRLGDHACMDELSDRMHSLTDHCVSGLLDGLRACATGDLTVELTPVTTTIPEREGEQGELPMVFNLLLKHIQASMLCYNEMRASLASMVTQISESSDTVATASNGMATASEEAGRAIAEIAHAVTTVAAGAEQQVRSVDDARRVVDELAEASRRSAAAADDTESAAEQARSLARDGVRAAGETSDAIRAVRDSSESTSEAIRSLGEKSVEIGSIVETITRLAGQTNLLALNAAIEAARAGEHGRGFAVVAEEVRQLAEESQRAAANIGQLIDLIQHDTTQAIETVEQGVEKTRSGVERVEQTRAAFEQIGRSVEDMSDRVGQIAGSIREIAASGEVMRESINSVAAVAESSSAATQEVSASTQQTSASTQQVAAGAQQLAITAEELERLVGQFVLA